MLTFQVSISVFDGKLGEFLSILTVNKTKDARHKTQDTRQRKKEKEIRKTGNQGEDYQESRISGQRIKEERLKRRIHSISLRTNYTDCTDF